MNFLARTLATAVAVAVAAFLVPGITVGGSSLVAQAAVVVVVALMVGLVNAVVRPIVKALTGCLILMTFGLFLLVINAAMLMLASWLASQLGFGFSVAGFLPAVLGSLVISLVSGLVSGVLVGPKDARS